MVVGHKLSWVGASPPTITYDVDEDGGEDDCNSDKDDGSAAPRAVWVARTAGRTTRRAAPSVGTSAWHRAPKIVADR